MAKKEYGNDSILALKGADRVRQRPGVIFGSDGLEGCEHAFFEILSNSIDEFREGYGQIIEVCKYKDGSISVEDFGRGIPVELNKKENRYNWELVFCELYAGGKFNNGGDTDYTFSLGLNGLGTCSTQYASEYMLVRIRRDGYEYNLKFLAGSNASKEKPGYTKKKCSLPTGTFIRWKPDSQVFTETDVPDEYLLDTIKRQAVINPGLTIIFKHEEGEEIARFCYENGIVDRINELSGGKLLTPIQSLSATVKGKDREDRAAYTVNINCYFAFSGTTQLLEYYHNSSWLEHGGSPDKAAKAAFVAEIDEYLRQTKKYTKSESKIAAQDVFSSLLFISNCFSNYTSYENQTKKAINNKFIQEAMTSFLREKLHFYLLENKAEAEKIANQVLINKRSREQSEKSRLNIRKKLSGSIDVINRIEKFVDCRSKDVNRRELYIVEGDSALGSCKQGRDSEFQAIMPVRGKILNCLKADYDKIFKSDIIVDLLKILGCGVEVKSKARGVDSFDLKKLRWNKVIICTDADVDGFQIRTLILTMLYRLTPTLIEKGFVYIAESPLYEITSGDKTYFAFDEREKTAIMKKLGKKSVQVQRSKGLGENEPEMMWETTMCPATRRLIQVLPKAGAELETEKTFALLLGDDLQSRKAFIADHGDEYLDQLDIS